MGAWWECEEVVEDNDEDLEDEQVEDWDEGLGLGLLQPDQKWKENEEGFQGWRRRKITEMKLKRVAAEEYVREED